MTRPVECPAGIVQSTACDVDAGVGLPLVTAEVFSSKNKCDAQVYSCKLGRIRELNQRLIENFSGYLGIHSAVGIWCFEGQCNPGRSSFLMMTVGTTDELLKGP